MNLALNIGRSALTLILVHPLHSQAADELLSAGEPFSQNGILSTQNVGPHLYKVEKGEINGLGYNFFYSDGSGHIGGERGASGRAASLSWDVGCSKDAISDKKMCHMTVIGKNLWVWAYPNGRYSVSIGQDHFPGSTATIRIDGGKPIATSARSEGRFSFQESAKIIAQLKVASNVTTRYMEWPNRYWVDTTWDLYAFNEALQYVTWAVNRIK